MSRKIRSKKKEGLTLTDSLWIKANPAVVFKALTVGSEIAHWFPDEARTDPKRGGAIVMKWSNGGAFESKFTTFKRNREISYLFYGDDRVTFQVKKNGPGTTVSVSHNCSDDSTTPQYIDITQNWTHLLWMLKWWLELKRDVRKELR